MELPDLKVLNWYDGSAHTISACITPEIEEVWFDGKLVISRHLPLKKEQPSDLPK